MSSVDECHGSYINWNRIFRKNLCIVYQNWNVYALWSRNSTSRNTSFRNIYTWAHKFLYKNVCCSTVCNGEKQQTSYVSYSRLRNCNPATQSGRNLAIKKKTKTGKPNPTNTDLQQALLSKKKKVSHRREHVKWSCLCINDMNRNKKI